MPNTGVIFDMDGVIVSTDEYHYQSWLMLAKDNSIDFNRKINNRLRGLGRAECIEIFVEKVSTAFSESQKIRMASQKNAYYLKLLEKLSPSDILPGVVDMVKELRRRRLKIAIGTSSKNCKIIIEKVGLTEFFDHCVDGNQVEKGKPNPEIFLKVAGQMGLRPNECVVIEDGEPGVEAALQAGMKVLGVGPAVAASKATLCISDLTSITATELLAL